MYGETRFFEAKDSGKVEVNKAELLSLSPKDLADRFRKLEKEGKLEQFINSVVSDDELLAAVSWWERWLSKSQGKEVDQAVIDRRKTEPTDTWELPLGLEKKFSEEDLKLIFSNMGAVQLTFGCSVGCKDCGFDALPGAREHLPFAQVKNLLERYGDILPKGEYPTESTKYKTFFFYASDPADYKSEYEGKTVTYKDVHELARKYTGADPFVSTRKTADRDWLKYVEELPTLTGEKRISTLGMSNERAAKLSEDFGKIVEDPRIVRGIGRNTMKDRSSMEVGGSGIGCFDGTVLTPRGLYNCVQVPVSERFPQGMIQIPLEAYSGVDIVPGDNLLKALRYGVVVNTPIDEYGTVMTYDKYNKGGNEFILYLNDRRKYVVVDKDFVIQEIRDSSKIEEALDGLVKRMEEKVKAAEKSKASICDLDADLEEYDKIQRLSRYPVPFDFYDRAVAAHERMDELRETV